jgi:hypothetical protein
LDLGDKDLALGDATGADRAETVQCQHAASLDLEVEFDAARKREGRRRWESIENPFGDGGTAP